MGLGVIGVAGSAAKENPHEGQHLARAESEKVPLEKGDGTLRTAQPVTCEFKTHRRNTGLEGQHADQRDEDGATHANPRPHRQLTLHVVPRKLPPRPYIIFVIIWLNCHSSDYFLW